MKLRECLTCGAPLSEQGKCRYCGNTFTDVIPDEISPDLSRATSYIREGNFIEARRILEDIISSVNNHNSTVYFQKALAVNEIAYVEDPNNNNKRIPTFWNSISQTPFSEEEDIKLALRYASTTEKSGLLESIHTIESLRIKYLELYKTLPSYDVFISYKESDIENGVAYKTQDSDEARDIYDFLTKHGFKVFFSKITLKNHLGEEYEPIIYHAIQSSKMMIVYGSKIEYINSRWIANEWKRYKYCIDKGQKAPNSLIVLYQDLDPEKLPVSLRGVQSLKVGPTTLEILVNHIRKVFAASEPSGFEQIEIKKRQFSPKVSKLERQEIKTIDIDLYQPTSLDITMEDKFSIVKAYIRAREWSRADEILKELSSEYPDSKQAQRYRILVELQSDNTNDLVTKIVNKRKYDLIPLVVDSFQKDEAEAFLKGLYKVVGENNTNQNDAVYILKLILPYSFEDRDICVRSTLARVIIGQKFKVFEYLLNALNENDVEAYINYYYQYCEHTNNLTEQKCCVKKILEVDPGNKDMLFNLVIIDLYSQQGINDYVNDLENLLSVSDNTDDILGQIIDNLIKAFNKDNGVLSVKTLRYMDPQNYSYHSRQILDLASLCCRYQLFDEAKQINNVAKKILPDNYKVYENDLLIRTQVSEIDKLSYIDTPLKELKEYTALLVHSGADSLYQQRLIGIENKQNALFDQKAKSIEQQRLKEEKHRQEQQEREDQIRKEKAIVIKERNRILYKLLICIAVYFAGFVISGLLPFDYGMPFIVYLISIVIIACIVPKQ